MKYGFQGRLAEAFPAQIIVNATEICNLAFAHYPTPILRNRRIAVRATWT